MDTVWFFGPFALALGAIAVAINLPNIALMLIVLGGMPTWFWGLLFLSIKSDELLGVKHAYGYRPSSAESNQNLE